MSDSQVVKVPQKPLKSYADLTKRLAAIAPTTDQPEGYDLPEVEPRTMPSDLTSAMSRAMTTFRSVVPSTKRDLTDNEVELLVEEKGALDTIAKGVKARLSEIRTAVFNAMDLREEAEGNVPEDEFGQPHLTKTAITAADGRRLSREPRNPSVEIDSEALRVLAADPDSPLSHNDYLTMTKQVRVVVPEQVMLHLKSMEPERREEVIRAIHERASRVTRKASAALSLRGSA